MEELGERGEEKRGRLRGPEERNIQRGRILIPRPIFLSVSPREMVRRHIGKERGKGTVGDVTDKEEKRRGASDRRDQKNKRAIKLGDGEAWG